MARGGGERARLGAGRARLGAGRAERPSQGDGRTGVGVRRRETAASRSSHACTPRSTREHVCAVCRGTHVCLHARARSMTLLSPNTGLFPPLC